MEYAKENAEELVTVTESAADEQVYPPLGYVTSMCGHCKSE